MRRVVAGSLVAVLVSCASPLADEDVGAARLAITTTAIDTNGDATIDSISDYAKNRNFGGSSFLYVDDWYGDLIGFDDSAVATAVGANRLLSATLRVELEVCHVYPDGLALHRLEQPWGELDVTWSCAHDTNLGNYVPDCPAPPQAWASGLEPSYAPVASAVVAGSALPGSSTVEIDVTADVLGFLDGTYGGLDGWILLQLGGSGSCTFVAKEHASRPAPQLVLKTAPPGYVPAEPTPPPLDRSVVTTGFEATQFLYTGDDRVQWAMGAATIDPDRAAHVRGIVRSRDAGGVLEGVEVRVLGQPQYGWTMTRTGTGMFDLVVNGGGALTLEYTKEGYLPVQRRIDVEWGDEVWAPDVLLVEEPPDCSGPISSATWDVFVGPSIDDGRGSRRTAVYVPEGRTVSAGGTGVPTYRICAGEYTVDGAAGPAEGAMPGELPPETAFTFASELRVKNASTGLFVEAPELSAPVYAYVENFLGFPVGGTVPAGYYDLDTGAWVPLDDGVVIELVDAGGGTCTATGGAVGSTEATRMCQSGFAPGTELWRIPLTHFTPVDFNWPGQPPADAVIPYLEWLARQRVDRACSASGSILDCDNRALGEAIPIAGTDYALVYRSDRQRGRLDAYTLRLKLSDGVAGSRTGIVVEVQIAGQRWRSAELPPAQTELEWTWDGLDAWGRTVQGPQPALVRLGYVYPLDYGDPSGSGGRSFALPRGTTAEVSPASRSVTFWHARRTHLGTWDDQAKGLGGWSLDVHHAYDPITRTLYHGDGRTRSAESRLPTIRTVATSLTDVKGIAVAGDGSVIAAVEGAHRVVRVEPTGAVTVLAGTGSPGYDPGVSEPTSSRLSSPRDVSLAPDGRIFIADSGNHCVRVLVPASLTGTGSAELQDFAGDCGTARPSCSGSSGDGGDALSALFQAPNAVAVGPAGELYVGDGCKTVRAVLPDGRIHRRAGADAPCGSGITEGQLAVGACLDIVGDLAVDGHGRILIADDQDPGRVLRVTADGRIWTFAGGGGDVGEGVAALGADLGNVRGLTVAPNGDVYVSERAVISSFCGSACYPRVRRIVQSGKIFTVAGPTYPVDAGDTFWGTGDDHTPAQRTLFGENRGVAVDGRGRVYVADWDVNRLRVVEQPVTGGLRDDHVIPSEDGRLLYAFDAAGLHLRTVDAITGSTLLELAYDSDGRLASVTDLDGNVTTVLRTPTFGIESPGGLVTALEAPGGYLTRLDDPDALYDFQFTYKSGYPGLLESMTDARGGSHGYTHDVLGLLLTDTDPALATQTLSEVAEGVVERTTALGRVTTYTVSHDTDGVERTLDPPDAPASSAVYGFDGVAEFVLADGTEVRTETAPDPRFGSQAPYIAEAVVTRPLGTTTTLTMDRSVVLGGGGTLDQLTETLTRASATESRQWTRTITRDASGFEVVLTPPSGLTDRRTVMRLDLDGRPVAVTEPGRHTVQLGYDPDGLLDIVVQGPSGTPDYRRTTFDYHPSSRALSTIVSRVGSSSTVTTSIVADDRGWPERITFPGSLVLELGHDGHGNVESVKPPGRPAHLFDFTPADLLDTYTPPSTPSYSGVERDFQHDADRDFDTMTVRSATWADASFEPTTGRLSSLSTTHDTLAYTYHPTGQLASIDGAAVGLSLGYDGPLLVSESWSGATSGGVGRTIDGLGELVDLDVTLSGRTQSFGFDYDVDGYPTEIATPSGTLSVESTPEYTGYSLGSIVGIAYADAYGDAWGTQHQTRGPYFEAFVTARDRLGRATEIVEYRTGIGTRTLDKTVQYDSASRVKRVVDATAGVLDDHTYGANGNLSSIAGRAGTRSFTYNYDDQITSAGYSYDGAGQLASSPRGTFEYDALGQLRSFVDSGTGVETTYEYDGLGRRVAVRVSGVVRQRFVYLDDLRPGAWEDVPGDRIGYFVYAVWAHVPDLVLWDHGRDGTINAVDQYVHDERGSVLAVVDRSSGAVRSLVDYETYGWPMGTGIGYQPFGFAGGIWDAATETYHFGARDYDPWAGRWTTKDPSGFAGGTNLYQYAYGDPINYIDIDGELPIAPIIVGGVIGGGTELVLQLLSNGGSFECVDWGQVAGAAMLGAAFGASARMAGWMSRGASAGGAADDATRVFWSGGDAAKNAAGRYARRMGGTTLEMTPRGRVLESAGLHWSEAKPLWQNASRSFAEGARGRVDVFIGRTPRPDSIWRTIEKPALLNNPAVTGIRVHLAIVP